LTLTNYFITYWTFKKCVIKTNQVVSSKYGLSLDVLTEILESWSRITNLTLTNYFITYWTFKKCVIKTNQMVSSKYGLSLDVLTEILESWSRITNLTLTNYFITYWTFKKCVIKTSQAVSSKCGLSLDVLANPLIVLNLIDQKNRTNRGPPIPQFWFSRSMSKIIGNLLFKLF
jgi:hypothetical protein